jgi:hypothetical protein
LFIAYQRQPEVYLYHNQEEEAEEARARGGISSFIH